VEVRSLSAAVARRVVIAVLSLSAAGAACPLLAGPAFADPAGAGVVISEVYGGGGNSGSHYKADFVELVNPAAAAVDLTGWTVQYRAATGTTVSKTASDAPGVRSSAAVPPAPPVSR